MGGGEEGDGVRENGREEKEKRERREEREKEKALKLRFHFSFVLFTRPWLTVSQRSRPPDWWEAPE